MIFLILGKAKF